ncbi:hypothetical protein DB346_08605 [Verrucomicrobia bacterium LW23]|nr:hypothetical protein DB346_08605 [Verrucomicrobia bacterium LW23]
MKPPEWLRRALMYVALRGDTLGEWITSKSMDLFGWAYEGSEAELRAVSHGEIPPAHMTPRQRSVLSLPPRCYHVKCVGCSHDKDSAGVATFEEWKATQCGWTGTLDQAVADRCPRCGETVYLEPLDLDEEEIAYYAERWNELQAEGGGK